MTSAKFLWFWTPYLPLSVPNSRNLPSFGQKLANPPPRKQTSFVHAPFPTVLRLSDFTIEIPRMDKTIAFKSQIVFYSRATQGKFLSVSIKSLSDDVEDATIRFHLMNNDTR